MYFLPPRPTVSLYEKNHNQNILVPWLSWGSGTGFKSILESHLIITQTGVESNPKEMTQVKH